MNKNLLIFSLVLAVTVSALAIWPINGRSSAAEKIVAMPVVFLADVEGQVCASETPVHTTTSQSTAKAGADEGDTMPHIFMVMLEDGVCASLSPISVSSQPTAPSDPKQEEKSFAGITADSPKKTRSGVETGVWYVQN